jgi:cyclic beta-1,2-glucan synthetase
LAGDYLPWLLPEFAPLRASLQSDPKLALKTAHKTGVDEKTELHSPQEALILAESLAARLASTSPAGDASTAETRERFGAALQTARRNLEALISSLQSVGRDAERLAEDTDFSFLVEPGRQILSIGYDAGTHTINPSNYDLVASEARIATYLAIASGHMPQQSWFKLARDHTFAYGQFVLLSWTGTMFEYLMPALWMRSYPGTLIANTQEACVEVQKEYAQSLNIPWGISESGYAKKDDAGHYQYHAFGIPRIALSEDAKAGPVISPYATFLALPVDTAGALENLRRMASAGWVGPYGFYESADFQASLSKPALVREWMAHHQGMSLLAVVNLLCDNVVERWFHENALVLSTERLLHEVPMSKAMMKSRLYELAPVTGE